MSESLIDWLRKRKFGKEREAKAVLGEFPGGPVSDVELRTAWLQYRHPAMSHKPSAESVAVEPEDAVETDE